MSFHQKLFFLLSEIFLINLNQGQYGLIQIVYLEKLSQFISKAHMVFLANFEQETIQFDSYC